MRYIIIICLLFLLGGCLPTTTNSIKKINVGDTRDEVIKKLGSPSTHYEYYNKEHLVYYVHDSFFSLFYSNEFPYIAFFPLVRTGDEYWVIMDNGKIVSHAKAKNYKGGIARALDSKGIYIGTE